MQTEITAGKENRTLDVFKFIACTLIAATHLPSLFDSQIHDFYFAQWFFRFCVPFFFVSSGYFFYKAKEKLRTIKRIAWLYALSYVLYLPAILEGAYDLHSLISRLRWNLVFGYEHLWYLSAALEGMLVWYLLEKLPYVSKIFHQIGIPACVVLMLLGALLDEHYRLIDNGVIRAAGEFLSVFGGPRNAIFMGFPLLTFGGAIARYEDRVRKIPTLLLIAGWVVLRGLAYKECTYLYENLGFTINNDLSFFGCWPAVILFELSFRFDLPIPEGGAKLLRKLAEYVYILHPLIAMLISKYLYLEPIPLWIATLVLCSAIYILLEKQFVVKK